MHDPDKSGPENVCRELVIAFQGVLSWKWDSQFEAALAEISIDNNDRIRAIVERYLSSTWNRSNIGKAPKVVQMIANHFGGLRSGQMLFVSAPNQDVLICGVWWPWGDGKTISFRVAPYKKSASESETAEIITQFKGWFGL
jgi:hypothetical protein